MSEEPAGQQFAASARDLSDEGEHGGTTLPVADVFAASDIDLPETLDLSDSPAATLPSKRARGAVERPSRIGRYEILSELGRGGMGVVLLARDPELRREVAVKLVAETRSLDQVQLARFVAEAQITSQLDHPNIVPVHDMGVTPDGELFFVMKRVQGVELAEILNLLRQEDEDAWQEWTEHRLLTAFVKVCQGVAYAHRRGVLHRDLKPANVMLGEFGEVLVMDWGVARLLTGRPEVTRRDSVERATVVRTLDGVTIGTPGYMSPEQARGEIDRLDTRSDVWSLGAILYELLTLHRAYQASSVPALLYQTVTTVPQDPSEKAPDRHIHPQIEAVCMRALSPDPGNRFADAEELADAVDEYLEGTERRAAEEGRLKRRNRIVGGAAIVLAGAALILLGQWQETEAERARAEENLQESRARTLLAEAGAPGLAHDPARQLSLVRSGAAIARGISGADGLPEDVLAGLHRRLEPASLSLELPGVKGEVLAAAFSPSGASVLAGGDDGSLSLWAADTGIRDVLWTNPGGAVRAVAWSSDGRFLAAGGVGGGVFLYDLEERVALPEVPAGEDDVTALALSDDGGMLSVGVATRARLYDVEPRVRRWEQGGEGDWIWWIDFAGDLVVADGGENGPGAWSIDDGVRFPLAPGPDARLDAADADERNFVGGYSDGQVAVWSLEDGSLLRRDTVHRGGVEGVALSPDGDEVASGSTGGSVRVSTVDTLAASGRMRGHRQKITSLKWSPSGDRLATASYDRTVRVWSPDGAELAALTGHGAWVTAVDWRPSGAALASASADGTLRIWSPSDAGPARVLRQRRAVSDLALSPDGETVALAGDDGRVRLWSSKGALGALEGPGLVARSLTWSPSGTRLAFVGASGGPQVWDPLHRRPVTRPDSKEPTWAVAWSPEGLRLAGADLVGGWRVWDSRNSTLLAEGRTDQTGRSHALWADEGRTLLISHPDGVAAFDPALGTELWSHDTAGTQHDRALALAGSIVVTEDAALGAVVVRTARDGQARHRLDVGSGELSQLVGAGSTVAAATEGGNILVFDAASGEVRLRRDRLGADVRSLSVDDGGRLLAAALSGGEVRVWSLTSGTLRTAFVVPGGEVTALRFSPDSDALWTGSEDGAARLWHSSQRPETAAVDVYAGTRTNHRVCFGELRPVAVVPFPPSDSVWAEEDACN